MATVQAEPYEFAFEPRTAALVVIDMQREFVDPGGFGEALGNDVSLLRKAIAPTKKVLEAARKRGLLGGETLGWAKAPLVALGYALFGVICLALGGRKDAPA